VFGHEGFLGSYLKLYYQVFPQTFFCGRTANNKLTLQIGGVTVNELPWSYNAIRKIINELQPEVIINSIALTNSKECERNPHLAKIANAQIPSLLAEASSQVNARLVHVSSDAVFGQAGSFFTELDIPQPKSVYGATKLLGEEFIVKKTQKYLIIRTNFYGFHSTRLTLFNYFYNNFKLENPVIGYKNVFFNPIYVKDLVLVIDELIRNRVSGIIHISGKEKLSKYEFGYSILKGMNAKEALLSSRSFDENDLETEVKLDLTLSSTRDFGLQFNYDVKSGVNDAIRRAKVTSNEF
jgi:dTDP-4-dehydrorhamnose reductase